MGAVNNTRNSSGSNSKHIIDQSGWVQQAMIIPTTQWTKILTAQTFCLINFFTVNLYLSKMEIFVRHPAKFLCVKMFDSYANVIVWKLPETLKITWMNYFQLTNLYNVNILVHTWHIFYFSKQFSMPHVPRVSSHFWVVADTVVTSCSPPRQVRPPPEPALDDNPRTPITGGNRRARLAALAQNINSWEDDLRKTSTTPK